MYSERFKLIKLSLLLRDLPKCSTYFCGGTTREPPVIPGLPRAHLVSSSVKPGHKTAESLFWPSSNDQGRKRFLRNGFCTYGQLEADQTAGSMDVQETLYLFGGEELFGDSLLLFLRGAS